MAYIDQHAIAIVGVDQLFAIGSQAAIGFLKAAIAHGIALVVGEQAIAITQLSPQPDHIHIIVEQGRALMGKEEAELVFLDGRIDVSGRADNHIFVRPLIDLVEVEHQRPRHALDGSIQGIGGRTRGQHIRITSYNVCYTKLLRRYLQVPRENHSPQSRHKQYRIQCHQDR